MKKRYQVFISSTYVDLIEERRAAMEEIIRQDCFPAGMELFPATDIEQFEYIKKVIDDSDYYILIVAEKYGTVDEYGLSYTEKEFDYAQSKGIPILTFIRNSSNLSADKLEEDKDKKEKLLKFKKKAENSRIRKMWKNSDELKNEIGHGLKYMFESNPRSGWIKAKNLSDGIINKENEIMDLIPMVNDKFQIHFDSDENCELDFIITLKDIILTLGKWDIREILNKNDFKKIIETILKKEFVQSSTDTQNYYLVESSLDIVIAKMTKLSLIENLTENWYFITSHYLLVHSELALIY